MVSNHPQCLGFSRSYHVHKGTQLAWSRSLLEQRIGLQAKKCWHLLFPQTFCPLMSKEKSKELASARLVSDHGEDLGGGQGGVLVHCLGGREIPDCAVWAASPTAHSMRSPEISASYSILPMFLPLASAPLTQATIIGLIRRKGPQGPVRAPERKNILRQGNLIMR